MSSAKSVENHAAVAVTPPVTVWILVLIMSAMAFVFVVGLFLFAFPMGGPLGYIVGTLLVAAGIGYATIAWHLRRGERAVWTAALVLPIVHTLGLNTLDLTLYGAIPGEDYPGGSTRRRTAPAPANHTPILHEVARSGRSFYDPFQSAAHEKAALHFKRQKLYNYDESKI